MLPSSTTARTRAGAALVALAFLLQAGGALAQNGKQPSAAAKTTARNLLLDCREKFGKKDLASALKSCQGGHAIMNVPSTGLDLAKVQEAMGLLVEARETALDVTRFNNAANNATYAEAQAEASQIAQNLETRIPSLVINVTGAPEGAELAVKVDNDAIPAAAMSLPYKVNPGEHTIVASAPGTNPVEQKVTVQTGQTKTVDLALSRASSASPPGPSGGGDAKDPWNRPKDEIDKENAGGRQIPAWSWIAGGVGLVGLGVGVGFGVDFSNAQETVARDCPDNQCIDKYSAADADALQSRWNRSLILTIAGSVVGATGLGLAIYGIATAPKVGARAATVVPWIGPGQAGLTALGRF